MPTPEGLTIRRVQPGEFQELGALTVDRYQALPDMPSADVFPGYYESMRDVATRVATPHTRVLVAIDADGALLGGVTFIEDMRAYGAGVAEHITNAGGVRLLVVAEAAEGRGIGKALTLECVQASKGLGHAEVVLHTMRPMVAARGIYERLGFKRAPELDFCPDELRVLGFRLAL